MDIRHRVIINVISQLNGVQQGLLASKEYILIIRSRINGDHLSFDMKQITKDNVGCWYDECMKLKTLVRGYLVLTRIEHQHNIMEYISSDDIRFLI